MASQRSSSDQNQHTSLTIFFENSSSQRDNRIKYIPYLGTRSRNHHEQKLYIAQIIRDHQIDREETYADFVKHLKNVFGQIPSEDLPSIVVTIRTGVSYLFSRFFKFNHSHPMTDLPLVLSRSDSLNQQAFYRPSTQRPYSSHDYLRSAFANMKPISETKKFAEELANYQFRVQSQKHLFRIYLKSDDGKKHVCTLDPALNYSIIEFSKDFQRVSNIDIIRDRTDSRFARDQTYDDIFDFRIQFQCNPRQSNDIEEEFRRQFPDLPETFRNEFILQPIGEQIGDFREFEVLPELVRHVQFIRRDFGDVYEYQGDDEIFENFTIFLESSVEYRLNTHQNRCERELNSHGVVHARLELKKMLEAKGTIDEDLLAWKLWDMGIGLSDTAGKCTTSATQQATTYYTHAGETYTAEDEKVIQTINKYPDLPRMLGLDPSATHQQIQQTFRQICNQLENRYMHLRSGPRAWTKLHSAYEEFFQQ